MLEVSPILHPHHHQQLSWSPQGVGNIIHLGGSLACVMNTKCGREDDSSPDGLIPSSSFSSGASWATWWQYYYYHESCSWSHSLWLSVNRWSLEDKIIKQSFLGQGEFSMTSQGVSSRSGSPGWTLKGQPDEPVAQHLFPGRKEKDSVHTKAVQMNTFRQLVPLWFN